MINLLVAQELIKVSLIISAYNVRTYMKIKSMLDEFNNGDL